MTPAAGEVVLYRCPSGKHGYTGLPCDSPQQDAIVEGRWLPLSAYAALVARVGAMEKALEFYADPKSYERPVIPLNNDVPPVNVIQADGTIQKMCRTQQIRYGSEAVLNDDGERACAALAPPADGKGE